MPKREFTVLSLFSGGMGLDIGLEKTGQFKLRACVEKVPASCQRHAGTAFWHSTEIRDLTEHECALVQEYPKK